LDGPSLVLRCIEMKYAANHTRSYKNGIVKIRSGEFCKWFKS